MNEPDQDLSSSVSDKIEQLMAELENLKKENKILKQLSTTVLLPEDKKEDSDNQSILPRMGPRYVHSLLSRCFQNIMFMYIRSYKKVLRIIKTVVRLNKYTLMNENLIRKQILIAKAFQVITCSAPYVCVCVYMYHIAGHLFSAPNKSPVYSLLMNNLGF